MGAVGGFQEPTIYILSCYVFQARPACTIQEPRCLPPHAQVHDVTGGYTRRSNLVGLLDLTTSCRELNPTACAELGKSHSTLHTQHKGISLHDASDRSCRQCSLLGRGLHWLLEPADRSEVGLSG